MRSFKIQVFLEHAGTKGIPVECRLIPLINTLWPSRLTLDLHRYLANTKLVLGQCLDQHMIDM